MNKHGILFQGLPVYESKKASFVEEESGYEIGKSRICEKYMDVTYFLLYVLCQNADCHRKLAGMTKERAQYLLHKAEKSEYKGEYFWLSLEERERHCAKLILGLLEEIRYRHDDRAKKAWIAFWYLTRCGFREEYALLRGRNEITLKKLCRYASKYQERPYMGTGLICIFFLIAEDLNVKILHDSQSSLFYSCIKEGNILWKSVGYEIIKECLEHLKEEK